ncbi:MAG: gliding motility-associated ABC transporter permease subunit GldF [Fluviicola sp. XM-24bin1]|nr:MAG: gliding motility-associated ABC transporter permease subunit GldF [Fluviicola sp. XM-24bin1]
MRALYFKEIRSFLSSIIGYIFILIFLITSGLSHWLTPEEYGLNLLLGGEADLIPFFNWSPWIFLFLIPAITMRSIAEERRTGTIELLFTRPISDFKIIMAKYLASVTLLVIALLPTLTYYITMHYIGDPVGIMDDGSAIASYFAMLLLGASFIAIGIFASTLTSSQIVAFILGAFLCSLLYAGFYILGSYNILGSYDSIFQYFGMYSHYSDMMGGAVNTKDIVYFLTIIILFIFGALTVIKSLKK